MAKLDCTLMFNSFILKNCQFFKIHRKSRSPYNRAYEDNRLISANLFINSILSRGTIPLITKSTKISNSSSTIIGHITTRDVPSREACEAVPNL